ncbi:unnamed protein product, partial [Phaeothamnion confervicola]
HASIVSRVRELAHANTYQMRQTYLHVCQRLAGCVDRRVFVAEFAPSFAELAMDRVVNVRIAMARTL